MTQEIARRGYAVCTAPRSGSGHLDNLLRSTGVLGNPLEYFNTKAQQLYIDPQYPADPEAQIDWILGHGSTPNGVYGLKIFADQFDLAAKSRWATRLPNLSFIYLERRDVLGQALSMARAKQTDQWNSGSPLLGEAVYDRTLIAAWLVEILRQYTRWRYYFARNGLTPLRLVYEDFVQKPAESVSAVARLIGLTEPTEGDFDGAATKVQRDELTELWRRRFIEESADLGTFH
jgi:LPS sulfotransferase NodH